MCHMLLRAPYVHQGIYLFGLQSSIKYLFTFPARLTQTFNNQSATCRSYGPLHSSSAISIPASSVEISHRTEAFNQVLAQASNYQFTKLNSEILLCIGITYCRALAVFCDY